MTDGAALLAAIAAHPAEDVPRLAYADWLAENGLPEEGEFIRVQCRLAALPPDDPAFQELLLRERELSYWRKASLPTPQWKLRGGLSINTEADWCSNFVRGFPRLINLKGNRQANTLFALSTAVALKKLFARIPTRWLNVGFVSPGQLANLLRQPIMEQLERLSTWSLTSSSEQVDELVRILAITPTLRNLRGLMLGFAIGPAAADVLAQAEFPHLESFSLDARRLTASSLHTLGRAPWFRNLRELLIEDAITDEAWIALLGAGPFPRLHTLILPRQDFETRTWEAWARAEAFPGLKRLDLEMTHLARGKMTALAGARGFSLASINLDCCAINNDDVAALTRAPWAESLQSLDVSGNRITTSGVRSLTNSPRMSNLRVLNLASTSPGSGGLSALASSAHLTRLLSLNLSNLQGNSHTSPTAAHVRDFLSTLNIPELRLLNLSGLPMNSAGAAVLARNAKFAHLRQLFLNQCRLSDEGAKIVLASQQFQDLVHLSLEANDLNEGLLDLLNHDAMPQLVSCRVA